MMDFRKSVLTVEIGGVDTLQMLLIPFEEFNIAILELSKRTMENGTS